jgi:hypothetical protein
MEQTYKIIGIQSGDGYKKLELKPLETLVQNKEKDDLFGAAKMGFGGVIKKTAQMYKQDLRYDIIRVPDEEYKRMHLEIDSTFTINY